MTQSDVEALLPVITPFAVPAAMDSLYTIAYDQFVLDAPSCLGTSSENTAITYYIESMLASGAGNTGVKSEKLDDYAIAYGEGGPVAAAMAKYQAVVDKCNYYATLTGITDGITRGDTLEELDLDNAGVVDVSGNAEFVRGTVF